MKALRRILLPLLFCAAALIVYRYLPAPTPAAIISPDAIPDYAGIPYVEINGSQPDFAANAPLPMRPTPRWICWAAAARRRPASPRS